MRGRFLAWGLSVAAALVPWPHAHAADAVSSQRPSAVVDPSGIYGALGIDRIPADYVILIDVSGSMGSSRRYDGVKNSLRGFFAALAPEDQVTLVTFAGDATVVWQGPAGGSPDAIVDRLPVGADGANTDIGKALEKAVDLLSRNGAPGTANVLLLSDGEHDPARGSKYPFTSGYSWNELRSRVGNLRQASIQGTAIPLAGATGAILLRQVFSQTQVVDPGAIGELTVALDKAKEGAKAAKARQVLTEDTKLSVQMRWSETRDGLRLEVRSPMRHIPLQLSQITVRSSDPSVRLTVRPQSLTLAPGESRSVEVQADWDSGPLSFKPFATATLHTTLTAAADITSPWAGSMREDLKMQWSPGRGEVAREMELAEERGSWRWWLAATFLLAALGAGVRALAVRRMHPSLHGVLSVSPPGSAAVSQVVLNGRKGKLTAATTTGLTGYGEVRLDRATLLSPAVDLVIRYSRDGSADRLETARCAANGSTVLGDVTFAWRPAR